MIVYLFGFINKIFLNFFPFIYIYSKLIKSSKINLFKLFRLGEILVHEYLSKLFDNIFYQFIKKKLIKIFLLSKSNKF